MTPVMNGGIFPPRPKPHPSHPPCSLSPDAVDAAEVEVNSFSKTFSINTAMSGRRSCPLIYRINHIFCIGPSPSGDDRNILSFRRRVGLQCQVLRL